MDLTIRPGVANTVMGSMGTAQEQNCQCDQPGRLPAAASNIHPANGERQQPTTVGLNGTSAPDLTPEQQQELKLTVQPGTLVGMDGQKMTTGQVGVSLVPPDLVKTCCRQEFSSIRLTSPFKHLMWRRSPHQHRSLFRTCSTPPPGTQVNVLSFDHTTGRLEIDGTATISADGKTATTDPRSGITHPGWHA